MLSEQQRVRHTYLNSVLGNQPQTELNLELLGEPFLKDCRNLISNSHCWIKGKFDYDTCDNLLFIIEQKIDNNEY